MSRFSLSCCQSVVGSCFSQPTTCVITGHQSLFLNPSHTVLLLTPCTSTLHVHVPLFPFVRHVTNPPIFALLPMTFASHIVFPRAHELPPNTFVWHFVFPCAHELPPKTSTWGTAIPSRCEPFPTTFLSLVVLTHGSGPLQAAFVSCVATLLALFLPLWPSTRHVEIASAKRHQT
jgi:hypothetical protein